MMSNGESQRTALTPFLTKTFNLVEEPSINDVISWNEDGSSFVVWNPTDFAKDLLPKHFKHSNFSSFVRQLNTYVRDCLSSVLFCLFVLFFGLILVPVRRGSRKSYRIGGSSQTTPSGEERNVSSATSSVGN